MDNKLDYFGEILINYVRDNTISSFDKIINGTMKGLTAKSVQEKIENFSDEQKETLKWIIAKAVDISLDNMLFMFEEHNEIELLFDNENLKEKSDGLSGELYTEDGWIEKFSKQRYD